MKTSLECIPCLVRQSLEMARMVTTDTGTHERVLRDALHRIAGMDMRRPPPVMAQYIHRMLRDVTGVEDPYRDAKVYQNRMALSVLADMRAKLASSANSLMTAVRLAIAGNIIDMGANANVTPESLRASIDRALNTPLVGDVDLFLEASAAAENVLYLCDNAGEIVFDQLLMRALGPSRVTAAVRGKPVLNDATMTDAVATGLDEIVEVIPNGSDAPGTLLEDCSDTFRRRFETADMIIAKGQGNFETLSDLPDPVFFLFQAKCPVIAEHAGVPLRAHVLVPFGR
ncbi:MAG: ARMT1-like domain-containing protein [Deltaproteobacteria bacterium]|nr:ARMT1-like domain-containing protein [Deltaproteobacteria bacterium]